MSDALSFSLWLAILAGGLTIVVALRAFGVPATYARDLLHVGAGVWIASWPSWEGHLAPFAIVAGAVAVVVSAPRALVRSVTGDDERWTGIVLYVVAFALFTMIGLVVDPLPAAVALAALSLGDGLGGFVGRRFGRRRFTWGRKKSLEGTAVVAIASFVGAFVAAALVGGTISVPVALVVAVVAALAEALAPASTDNLIVPVAVWIAVATTM